jgi:hypothetical protein
MSPRFRRLAAAAIGDRLQEGAGSPTRRPKGAICQDVKTNEGMIKNFTSRGIIAVQFQYAPCFSRNITG